MTASVERLRWGLAVLVVLLVSGLLALMGYGRWTAARRWKDLLRHSGARFSHESDNVTYSQTVQGRTVFTIRAKKAVPYGDGKWTLHGVTMLLYGKGADRIDRIEGAEFEYDEKQGVARAVGDVLIDVQAPGALAEPKQRGSGPEAGNAKPSAPPAESVLDDERNVIHVRTSGLVYVRKLGIAATDQRVEFRYAGLTCVSQGAEFDTGGSTLHLLAAVQMDGDVRGAPVTVLAAKADLDQQASTIALVQPVLRSQGKAARAAEAVLQLRSDGSLQHADANVDVVLDSGEERVSAAHLDAAFSPASLPLHATLTGNVVLDGDEGRALHGTASMVDLAYSGAGVLTGAQAAGPVLLQTRSPLAAGGSTSRALRGRTVTAEFAPAEKNGNPQLRTMHAAGGASVRAEAPAAPGALLPGVRVTELAGDDLVAQFAQSKAPAGRQPTLDHLTAQGNTRLEQDAPGGEQQVSQSDRLEASFLPAAAGGEVPPRTNAGEGGAMTMGWPSRSAQRAGAGVTTAPRRDRSSGGGMPESELRVDSATEAGHVRIYSRAPAQAGKPGLVSTASGETGVFDGPRGRLTLSGSATFQQGSTSLSARSISVAQASGDAEAEGAVAATLAPARGTEADATHVLADRAHMVHGNQTAEFSGTDAHPARLWQAGSQILAANLLLDNTHRSLTARPAAGTGEVQALFASAQPARVATAPGARTSRSPGGAAEQNSAVEAPASKGASARRPASEEASDHPPHVQPANLVHVSAPSLHYSDLSHEAVLNGGVRVRTGETEVRAREAVVWLRELPGTSRPDTSAPSPTVGQELGFGAGQMGGSVDRILFSGDVRLQEPNRAGEGEHLLYTAETGTYALTGTPGRLPRVADAGQGTVTGTTLVFHREDNTVIVNGAGAADDRSASTRVHTEVEMRHPH